jgi:hypothetical protein
LSSHENEGSSKRLTKAQAQAFQKRWEILDAAEREELASTPMALKFRQLAALMASAQKLGWTEELAAEEDEVRKRWARLRQVLRA